MRPEWDDFRFVRAVAACGGLTGASAQLGIDHSTAFRRLAAIEARLDARLFERRRGGYVPTSAGLAMVEVADRIDADVARFSRHVAARADEPAGELRVTAPADLARAVLMPILTAFCARYPEIRLDLVLSERVLSLSRRDADVAIRATRGPDETLVGRRLTGIACAVYGLAGRAYGDLAREDWVGPGERVASGTFAAFVRARADPRRVRLQINAVMGLREAVAAGVGIGPLPCFEGDADPALRRLTGPEPELGADLWLLTHPELRRAARVRAFMDFVAAAIVPLRAAFEGAGRAG